MTEVDTESIWATALDTTRFGKIGVRMAELVNWKIYRDATNQCTNVAVLPVIEHFCEEVLILLIGAAKINGLHDPWEFIQGNVMRFFNRHYEIWKEDFEEIRITESQEKTIELHSLSGFGVNSDL